MSMGNNYTTVNNTNIGNISKMFELGVIKRDHPLQRRSGKHSKAFIDGFIATCIKNEDFDPIKMCDQGAISWVVDGVQRLTEIDEFLNGGYRLGKNIEMPIVSYMRKNSETGEFEEAQFDIRGVSYSDLPDELKVRFCDCPMTVIKHINCTDEQVAYHLRRYNHSVQMQKNEISITYAENMAEHIKNITTNNRFFLDCGEYKETERKKGVIEQVVMDSIMTVFHLEDWKKKEDVLGSYIRDNVSTNEINSLNEYFERLLPICEEKYEMIFNSKFTKYFIAAFVKFTEYGLPDKEFGRFLDAFERELYTKEINGDSFHNAVVDNRGTRDKKQIIRKINILESLMLDFFHLNKEENPSNVSENDTEIDSEKVSEEVVEESVNGEIHPENTLLNEEDKAIAIEFISEQLGIDKERVSEDLDLYNDMLDDYEDRTLSPDSRLLDHENRLSLLAMVAYGVESDIDLEDWFEDYGKRSNMYVSRPDRNLYIMKTDLSGYLRRKAA